VRVLSIYTLAGTKRMGEREGEVEKLSKMGVLVREIPGFTRSGRLSDRVAARQTQVSRGSCPVD
jgi:hypothetical protein